MTASSPPRAAAASTSAATPRAGPPPVERRGLGYVWARPDVGLLLRLDYLRERSDEFSGELTVESTLVGVPAHLHQARLNLSATRTRAELARHLEGLTPAGAVDWPRTIEAFCVAVMRLERAGEPRIFVGRLPGRVSRPDTVERLLPAGKPTIWYGPYGVGKSWLAAAACVCHETGTPLAGLAVQPGRTLYLDWEDDPYTLDMRVQMIACGLDLPHAPEIGYRKCRRTLARDLHAIVRLIADDGVTLVVIDSAGLAMGPPSEQGGFTDVALGFTAALRYLEPATVLILDHVAGADLKARDAPAGKPIGSVYKMAEARAAWEFRAYQEAGSGETELGLHHTKHNHTRKYQAMGFRLSFAPIDDDEAGGGGGGGGGDGEAAWVRLTRHDLRDSAELRGPLPIAEQITGVLRRGPREAADVAAELEVSAGTVRVTLSRGQGRRFVKLADGRWGNFQPADQPAPDEAIPGPTKPGPRAALRLVQDGQWHTERDRQHDDRDVPGDDYPPGAEADE